MTITEFLLARIAEDEEIAVAARGQVGPNAGRWIWDTIPGATSAQSRHVAQHDPARILAECTSRRELIKIAADQTRLARAAAGWANWEDMADQLLRSIALPYANHPDFDPAWRS